MHNNVGNFSYKPYLRRSPSPIDTRPLCAGTGTLLKVVTSETGVISLTDLPNSEHQKM